MRARTLFVAVALAVALAGCKDSFSPGNGSMQLRLENTSPNALSIMVGSTDFGSIAAGALSPYMEIGEGDLTVLVAGVNRGTEFFCSGCKDFDGTSRWTGTFDESGITGYSADFD